MIKLRLLRFQIILLCQGADCACRFLYRPLLQPSECVVLRHMFKLLKKALPVRLSSYRLAFRVVAIG